MTEIEQIAAEMDEWADNKIWPRHQHDRVDIKKLAERIRRLATPQPPKDAGAVPMPEVIAYRQTVKFQSEPWRIDTFVFPIDVHPKPEGSEDVCTLVDAIRYGDAREAAVRADAVLYEVANNLMLLVEGPGSLRWEDGEGFRLKDTSEWARFYVEVKNAKERTIPQHQPAEPAARAQVAHPSPAHAGAGAEALAKEVWTALDKESCPGVYMQIAYETIFRRLAGGDHA